MKKYIFLILITFSSIFVIAQDDNNKAERIQALKIAFITQKLQLTGDEAQKFWPIYNQYEVDLKHLNIQNKSGDVIDNEEKVLNLRKRYRSEFVRVLGQPKMNRLFMAEREFRGALIRKLRTHQQQKQLNRKAF